MEEYDLIEQNRFEFFADIDFGDEEIDYRGQFILIGGKDSDMFVVQRDDETMYAWLHESDEIDSEFYGSLLTVMQKEVVLWEADEAERKRMKLFLERIGRWWSRKG